MKTREQCESSKWNHFHEKKRKEIDFEKESTSSRYMKSSI